MHACQFDPRNDCPACRSEEEQNEEITMTNKSAIAEARRLVRDAEENLAARRRLLNGLLPELPASFTYDPEHPESGNQPCPHRDEENNAPCGARLRAYADTYEISPVLGWTDGYLMLADQFVRPDPVHEIQCGNGHAWRVPDHIDRDV